MHLDKWIAELRKGNCIPELDLKRLCIHVKNLLMEESNVQYVKAPVTVGIFFSRHIFPSRDCVLLQ